ncbi:MAG: prolyl oligopeptidase family serine peptidase [Chthoniobacteraceae bacterium]
MKYNRVFVIAAFLLMACRCAVEADDVAAPAGMNLTKARSGFVTKLVRKEKIGEPVEEPPANLFRLVKYVSPGGSMSAYVSPAPAAGGKHPAIIWIVGGFSNSIGRVAWTPRPTDNDQSASAFREAGIVMMYPSLRGGNDNPGVKECFYGEVDDVLAAADYLSKLDYVDPNRIYLGGHSTGGTLALLVAESRNRFRAVFAFGPVSDVRSYGADVIPFDTTNPREAELRAPGNWLQAIRTPTFVFEGTEQPGNIVSLRILQHSTHNPVIQFLPVEGATHFSTLAPVTHLIAAKILHDDDAVVNIGFTEEDLAKAMK